MNLDKLVREDTIIAEKRRKEGFFYSYTLTKRGDPKEI